MKKLSLQKIDIASVGKIVAGVAMLAVSGYFLHQSPTLTSAQNANDYSFKTTWTATNLLTMTSADFGPNWKTALGVSGWDVTIADTSGTKKYEETWQTAMPNTGIQVNTNNAAPGSVVGLDGTKWLFSINPIHVSWGIPRRWTFQSESVSNLNLGTIKSIRGMQDKVANGIYTDSSGQTQSIAGSCAGDGLWCIYPTGGYGWQIEINDNTNDSTPGAVGILMPLQWTVYGKQF